MQEITRIVTVEITDILKNVPEGGAMSKEEWAEETKDIIKRTLCADDVVITKTQDFVRDLEEDKHD